MKKLLLNFVYYRPVGHAVEAIKYAKGYWEANRDDIEIHLLLNADTPTELAQACNWIHATYPIDTKEVMEKGEKAESLKNIPREWDYIIADSRVKNFTKGWDEEHLIKTQDVLQNCFKAKDASGYTPSVSTFGTANLEDQILPYKPNAQITIPIPFEAQEFTERYEYDGPAIAVMLGGSAGAVQSPTVNMWLKICQRLFSEIPNLKIYFTGIAKQVGNRSTTEDFSLEDVRRLAEQLPNAELAYDIGLWNQLALIQNCDIFLSPHTGFAFLAPAVGTSWLALSNCRWQEYLFNNTPFYSVIPDCGFYPAQEETSKGCGKLLAEDKKALCMTDELLEKKIPEIIKGAALLLDSNFTYEDAMQLHLSKISDLSTAHKFFFFDGALTD